MDKYTLLIVMNAPLAFYGLFNVILLYKLKKLRPMNAFMRTLFWVVILSGIWFVRPLTDFLITENLTDSPPLSIFDVLLVTGLTVSFLLISRHSVRITELETKFTKLHEKLSVKLSDK